MYTIWRLWQPVVKCAEAVLKNIWNEVRVYSNVYAVVRLVSRNLAVQIGAAARSSQIHVKLKWAKGVFARVFPIDLVCSHFDDLVAKWKFLQRCGCCILISVNLLDIWEVECVLYIQILRMYNIYMYMLAVISQWRTFKLCNAFMLDRPRSRRLCLDAAAEWKWSSLPDGTRIWYNRRSYEYARRINAHLSEKMYRMQIWLVMATLKRRLGFAAGWKMITSSRWTHDQ